MSSVSQAVFQPHEIVQSREPVSLKTVRFSARELNDRVEKRIKSLPAEEGISKKDWSSAALAVYEIFCRESPYMLNTASISLLKRQFEDSLALHDKLGGNLYLGIPAHPRIEQIFNKVMGIYDEEFQKVQKNTLDESTIAPFRALYFKMLDSTKSVGQRFIDHCRRQLSYENQGTSLDYRNIVVELPMEVVEKTFEEHGVVQLRPIDPKATTLIIGCGNGRNCCAGSGAFWFEDTTPLCETTVAEYHKEYSLQHIHPRDIVTIDPDPQANPTIAAHFGHVPLAKLFNGQKFDRIIFEGYFDHDLPPYQKSDVQALLSDKGAVYLDQGEGPKLLPPSYAL